MDNQSGAIKNVYLHEDGKAVTIIDQTKLPTVTEYLTLGTAKDLYDAIFELESPGSTGNRNLCGIWNVCSGRND